MLFAGAWLAATATVMATATGIAVAFDARQNSGYVVGEAAAGSTARDIERAPPGVSRGQPRAPQPPIGLRPGAPVTPATPATPPAPAPPTLLAPSPITTAASAAPTTAAPVAPPAPTTPSVAPSDTAPPAPTAPAAANPAPPPPPVPASPGPIDQQILDLVNSERVTAGCDTVTLDAALTAAADGHAQDMKGQNYFSHSSLDGRSPFDRMRAAGYSYSTAGENIARGQADAAAVMTGWMNSPGHRANIVNCAFTDLGVGYEEGSGGPWWVQNFGG